MSGNELINFQHDEFGSVRAITIDNVPWFVAKDLATVLGYSNPRDAISKHVDIEDKGVAKCDTLGGVQELTVINESGLYALVLQSKLPTAKKFKHWVTSEVLPQIRKTGCYKMPGSYKEALLQLVAAEEEKERLLEMNNAMKPKALFADAVSTSKTSILIGDLAKLICQNGVEIGQKRLFDWLRSNNYLISHGSSMNMPTQKFLEQGLFEIKESTVSNPDGSVRVTRTTKVTGKGQVYFVQKFLGKEGKA